MNLYRAIRRGTLLKYFTGREPFHWVRKQPGVVELGSKYGRWGVDLTNLSESTTVVSVGLGTDVSFESALIAHCGCQVFGFDPTPSSVQYLAKNINEPRLTTFPYAISDQEGSITFALPPESAADQVSASAFASYSVTHTSGIAVPCLTLESARRKFNIEKIDILKLDIEGAEYAVLAQAVANGWLNDVSQVLVEFHHFLPGLTSTQTRNAIASMQRAGFIIAWVGRTNHEYLFTRKRKGAGAAA